MLRVLRLHLKVTIFQPELQEHAPRTTFVLKSCDFQAGAAADQEGIEPATAGLRKQARKPRDNFQKPFREQEHCTAHSESASTRTISAEGRARTAEIVECPQFLNLDHANLRRGSRARMLKIVKSPQFLNLDHVNLRRGSRAHAKNRKKSAVLNLDHANLRRGSRAHAKNRKQSPVFEPRPRESPQRVARAF